jgi:amino acid adenylation domain-containing protein
MKRDGMTQLLHEWASHQADVRPDAPAVIAPGECLTYGRLDAMSNQLARALKDAGCKRGDRVCLLMPASPTAMLGILGALKADAIVVPLDPSSPAARLAEICESCEPRVLLSTARLAPVLGELSRVAGPGASLPIGWLDPVRSVAPTSGADFSLAEVGSYPSTRPAYGNTRRDPAQILFTSGATGRPRGVVLTHANVIHLVEWALRYFGMRASDRISGQAALHVDRSTFDLFGALAAGAQLHVVPPEVQRSPRRLAAFVRTSALTQWSCIPSTLDDLAARDAVRPGDFRALRRIVWCGEGLPTSTLAYWMTRLPHVTFTKLYGRTEATIASSAYTVPEIPADPDVEIPIGTECDGEELLVLNDRLQPVGFGEVGELYIRGVGVSAGYWRDPEGTAAAFLPRPRARDASDRLYMTGDLARVGEDDGLVYCLGDRRPAPELPAAVNA